MATLEELLVLINASTDGLRRELNKGNSNVNSFQSSVDKKVKQVDDRFAKLGKSVRKSLAGLGLAFGLRGISRFAQDSIAAGDAIGKAAKTADFGAERFQRLQFAFEQGGVRSTEFDLSMQRLNRRLGLFIQNGGGPAAEAIKSLGLESDITNGTIQTSEQLFDVFVAKLQDVKNEAEAAAITSALFGDEAGPKLVQTLRLGTQGLKDMEDAATGVLSDEQVARAEALNDAFNRISRTVGTRLKGAFVDAATAAGQFFGLAEAFVTSAEIEEQIAALEAQAALIHDISRQRGDVEMLPGDIAQLEEINRQLEVLYGALVQIGNKSNELAANSKEFPIIDLPGLPEEEAPAFVRAGPNLFPEQEEFDEVRAELRKLEEQTLRSQGRMEEAIRIAADEHIREWKRVAEETPAFAEEAAEAIRLINEKATADIKNLRKADKALSQFGATFAAAFESRGIDALLDGDISNAVRGLIKDVAELILRLVILKPLAQFLGGIFGGGVPTIPGRAAGGPTVGGQTYLVGERGPELFTSDVPGRIFSASKTAGMLSGNVAVSQHFEVQAGLPPQWQAQLATVSKIAAAAATQAVTQQLGGRR